MSAKRRALTQKTKDNWDEISSEEDIEQNFNDSREDISKRKIIKAKRLSSGPNTPVNKSTPISKIKPELDNKRIYINGKLVNDTYFESQKDIEIYYLASLSHLNKMFVNWVNKVLEVNPQCDLTPIFNDYNQQNNQLKLDLQIETKIKSLEFKPFTLSGINGFYTSPKDVNITNHSQDNANTQNLLNNQCSIAISTKSPSLQTFSFKPISTDSKPNLNAGSYNNDNSLSKFQFSFTPQTLKNSVITNSDENNDEKDEVESSAGDNMVVMTTNDTDEPQFQESNCLWVNKCKLYRKEQSAFKDIGVGFCYIKSPENDNINTPVDNSKYQLLIRAANASGTVMLNSIVVKAKTPVTLTEGKNSVMIVIAGEPSATTYLLRFKTLNLAKEFYAYFA